MCSIPEPELFSLVHWWGWPLSFYFRNSRDPGFLPDVQQISAESFQRPGTEDSNEQDRQGPYGAYTLVGEINQEWKIHTRWFHSMHTTAKTERSDGGSEGGVALPGENCWGGALRHWGCLNWHLKEEGAPAEHRSKGSAPDRTNLVVHICNGILLSYKKELIWVNLNEVGEPRAYCTEWSKSERERQILYINACVWNLERWYWWTYLQGSNRDADIENRLADTVGEGEGGTNREISIEIYALLYVE